VDGIGWCCLRLVRAREIVQGLLCSSGVYGARSWQRHVSHVEVLRIGWKLLATATPSYDERATLNVTLVELAVLRSGYASVALAQAFVAACARALRLYGYRADT
jgi:hypothetical protein